MKKIRAFIALEMPDKIRRALDEISFRLRKDLSEVPLRWVPVDHMHLTLKFLGDISPEQVPAITSVLEEETASLSPFDLSVHGLGVFPNLQRPRVLWVGVNLSQGAKEFQREIESEVSKLGFSTERRPFSPHLTLARVRGHARSADLARIREVMTGTENSAPVVDLADTITLFRSDLKPSGSVYNALSKLVLSGKD